MQLEGSAVRLDDLASLALYNYGHFTSMRVEGMRVRGLSMHLDRLVHDSKEIHGTAVDRERVRTLVGKALRDGPDPAIARVTVFAPDFEMGWPSRGVEPKILVTARPAPTAPPSPLRVKSVCYERDSPSLKHTGLFGQLQQRRTAQLEGFDDALLIDADAMISEGVTWNVAFVQGGRVTWPKSDCLPGVTMRIVQETLTLARKESETVPIDLSAVAKMDAAFATNAGTGLRPISLIDGTHFPVDMELTNKLGESYWAYEGEPL